MRVLIIDIAQNINILCDLQNFELIFQILKVLLVTSSIIIFGFAELYVTALFFVVYLLY